jgi:hypothetical protein
MKKKMMKRANNQAPAPSPTQDLKCAQWESQGKKKKDAGKGMVAISLKCSLKIDVQPFVLVFRGGQRTMPPL